MNSLITREHNGAAFTFREDGYFNMTKAAKHFGKRMDNFFANEETRAYADALEAITGIPGNALIQAQRGGAPGNAGTWAHPQAGRVLRPLAGCPVRGVV